MVEILRQRGCDLTKAGAARVAIAAYAFPILHPKSKRSR